MFQWNGHLCYLYNYVHGKYVWEILKNKSVRILISTLYIFSKKEWKTKIPNDSSCLLKKDNTYPYNGTLCSYKKNVVTSTKTTKAKKEGKTKSW